MSDFSKLKKSYESRLREIAEAHSEKNYEASHILLDKLQEKFIRDVAKLKTLKECKELAGILRKGSVSKKWYA